MARKQQKEKMGCLQRIWHGIIRLIKCVLIFFGILLVIGFIIGDSDKKNTTVEQPTATAVITSTVVPTTTAKPTESPTVAPTPTFTKSTTEAPTATPTKEPVEIILKHPELGQYGVYYTFNEKVEKAEESDKETIIQCFVPAGVYTVTNVDRSPWTFVYVYSKETIITDAGWEEPAETWVSPMLKVGESCEVTIPEGWYINLQEKDHFKLVQNK